MVEKTSEEFQWSVSTVSFLEGSLVLLTLTLGHFSRSDREVSHRPSENVTVTVDETEDGTCYDSQRPRDGPVWFEGPAECSANDETVDVIS